MTMWLPLCFGGLYLAQGAIIQNINDGSHENKEFLDNKEKFYFETTSSMSQTKKLIDDFLTKNKLFFANSYRPRYYKNFKRTT